MCRTRTIPLSTKFLKDPHQGTGEGSGGDFVQCHQLSNFRVGAVPRGRYGECEKTWNPSVEVEVFGGKEYTLTPILLVPT